MSAKRNIQKRSKKNKKASSKTIKDFNKMLKTTILEVERHRSAEKKMRDPRKTKQRTF